MLKLFWVGVRHARVGQGWRLIAGATNTCPKQFEHLIWISAGCMSSSLIVSTTIYHFFHNIGLHMEVNFWDLLKDHASILIYQRPLNLLTEMFWKRGLTIRSHNSTKITINVFMIYYWLYGQFYQSKKVRMCNFIIQLAQAHCKGLNQKEKQDVKASNKIILRCVCTYVYGSEQSLCIHVYFR